MSDKKRDRRDTKQHLNHTGPHGQHGSSHSLHTAPHKAPIGRPDEVGAARNPIVRYTKA